MQSNKKINNDLFLLILLIARLGLSPDTRINNRWNREPESSSVFLGPTSAYTQTNFHAPFSNNIYPHPKSVEYNELDEATILFSRLNLYNSLRNTRDDLIALVANSLDQDGCKQYGANHPPDGVGNGLSDHSLQAANGNAIQAVNNGHTDEREGSLLLDVELSPEREKNRFCFKVAEINNWMNLSVPKKSTKIMNT
ncbi:segmentation protein cap'n'collar [Caerostris extrusa]|uniref:Segmentation protein cap'n'collar n=1 Tax=Caerostris extrusa TaxID=172846 RepID=A0AAV4PUD8_CAEEX|nr:segmentation protein cap'n'collar [Caerostris extrusa]